MGGIYHVHILGGRALSVATSISLECAALYYMQQEDITRNTAKVALSAQVIGIRQVGDLLPSAYFACSYIASEGASS